MRQFQSVWKAWYWWCNMPLIIINLSPRQGRDTFIHKKDASGLISSSEYIVQNMNVNSRARAHTQQIFWSDEMWIFYYKCSLSCLGVWMWRSCVIEIQSAGFIRAASDVLECLSLSPSLFLPPYLLNTIKVIPTRVCGKISHLALLNIHFFFLCSREERWDVGR